jgi:putative phosphoribosyl transferase
MYFKNRLDAAAQLAPLLKKYQNKDCIVLAVPRGGVPMGDYIAKTLHCPLDLLMTKKIGHPHNPEFAIGAVSLEGRLLNDDVDVPMTYIDAETHRLRHVMEKRYKQFMGNRKPMDVKNKTVIIVDDGIATGYTLMTAIELLNKKDPDKIVIAMPVAPPKTAEKIAHLVDDFICLYTPVDFSTISEFYEDFSEVTDNEAAACIHDGLVNA